MNLERKVVLLSAATITIASYILMLFCIYISFDLLINPFWKDSLPEVTNLVDLGFIFVYVTGCLIPMAVIVFGTEPLFKYLNTIKKEFINVR